MERQSAKLDSEMTRGTGATWGAIGWALLTLALLFQARSVNAQDHVWSQLVGGPNNTVANAIAVDGVGDIVIAGEFDGEMTVGDTKLSTGLFTSDGFVAKFSSKGVPLWAQQFGDTNSDSAVGVTIAPDGTVFAVGNWSKDVYLVAYDGDKGTMRWAQTFGGGGTDVGFGVVVNSRGEVVIVAGLQDSGTFGGEVLTSAGSYDVVLAAYKAANGAHLWSRRYGGAGGELVGGVAIDAADNLVITGNVPQSTDLGTGTLRTNGLSDIFVATYSALDGSPNWARTFGGNGYDSGEGAAFDPEGNILVTGYFGLAGSGVDFGGGVINSLGYADMFLAKYSRKGDFIWANGYGGIGDDYGRDITVDRAGNATVTGHFQLNADFGGGPISSKGQIDVFLAQYGPDGKHRWSSGHGNLVTEKAYGVAADPEGAVIVTGYTLWSIDFGGGLMFSAGYADAFLAKIAVGSLPDPTPTPTPDPDPLGVAGQVRYYSNNDAVAGVGVLMENSTASEWTETSVQGDYSVTGMHEGTWDVQPTKNGDFNKAISSLDAAFALQAAVGLRQLNEEEVLACDVTGNGRVSSLDAGEILRFVVGTSTGFPAANACGSDWLFIPKPAAAANQSVTMPEISGGQCLPGTISLDPLVDAVEGQDFLGILLGDCSGNWASGSSAALVRTRASASTAKVRQLRRSRRATARLPILIRSDEPVNAIDIQLRYDPAVLELAGATVRGSNRNVVVAQDVTGEGQATLAIASAEPLAAKRGTMIIVEFDVVGSSAPRGSAEVIYVGLNEKPAELVQRPARLVRR